MLCLSCHLSLGNSVNLKGLVQPEKTESTGLVLNIESPILIILCILSVAYFIYSEYSVEFTKKISKNDPFSRALKNRNKLFKRFFMIR